MTARYYKPEETKTRAFAPLIVSVDPRTGEVLRTQFWGRTLMTWIYDLHYTLLLDRQGNLIMTVAGLAGMLSLVTGIYVWWPRRGNFRAGLAVRLTASPQRRAYDLHKIAGIYLLPVVAVVMGTGIVLELPDTFNPLIGRWSALTRIPVMPPLHPVLSGLPSTRPSMQRARPFRWQTCAGLRPPKAPADRFA